LAAGGRTKPARSPARRMRDRPEALYTIVAPKHRRLFWPDNGDRQTLFSYSNYSTYVLSMQARIAALVQLLNRLKIKRAAHSSGPCLLCGEARNLLDLNDRALSLEAGLCV